MGAEIPDGAVIVARAILNSSLWKMRPADRIVAMTLIAICNKRPKKWFDGEAQITIGLGQVVRSREDLASDCNLPLQVVRTSIEHLEESGFLTRKLTRYYTLYTIPKYQHYQDLTNYSDSGVQKLTRDLTRLQPGKTSKSNPGISTDDARNPIEHKGDASLWKHCGENLTRENLKTNHKQQQHKNTSPTPDKATTPEGGVGGDVVVVQNGRWSDPILSKPAFRLSMRLLEEVKVAKTAALTFAAQKPVGIILRATEHAKLQRNPGGWARTALESGWDLPEINCPELEKIVDLLNRDQKTAETHFLRSPGTQDLRSRFPMAAGETEDQWFVRVSKEITKSKKQEHKAKR